MTAADTSPQVKRALLIGIDVYEIIVDLQGCKNDVELMESILRQRFGFTDIRKLVDGAATRDAILGAFDDLVRDTQPDDVVVIHYAGHGSQKTDAEGDEPSGMDSTLMPHDTHGKHGTPEQNLDITDDEIQLKLIALGERTSNITLIIDACHSGTITRDADDAFAGNIRGDEPDTRPASVLGSRIATEDLPKLKEHAGDGTPIERKYVVISGCRDDEKSGEAEQKLDDGTTRVHGALTHFLSRELRNASAETTYRDIFERAAAKVTALRNGAQHPQMEGESSRVLFGLATIEPMSSFRIASRDGDTVTLDAGAALGVTPGSRYAVHAEDTKRTEDAVAIGEIEITEVSVASSSATIVAKTDVEIGEGARAVLSSYRIGDVRLLLDVSLDEGAAATPGASELAAAMRGSPLFRMAKDGEAADARVQLLPGAGAPSGATWVVTGGDGQVIMPVKPSGEWDAVRKNLETWARSRLVLGLENPDRESAMRDAFHVELLRFERDGPWSVATPEPSVGMPVFENDDFVGLRISSTYDGDAYITLLEVGLSGSVTQLYPPGNAASEKLVRGDKPFDLFTVKGRNGGRKIFSLPDTFPYVAGSASPQQLEGTDTLKLFVTSEPTSFQALLQGGMRSDGSPLELLLQTGMGAAPTREGRDEVTLADTGDWTTVMRPFLLRQKRTVEATGKSEPLDVGYAKVTAAGISGTLTTAWGSASNTVPGAANDDALSQALASSGMVVKQAIVLHDATADSSRDDSAEPPVLDVQIAPPPEGFGQVMLSRDENGVYTWLLPSAPTGAARGDGDAAAPMQRFTVPVATTAGAATGDATRGAGAKAVNQVLKLLVYPLLEPVFEAMGQSMASAWEEKYRPYRVLSFSAESRASADALALDEAGWRRLSEGRALLLLHGPFSRAHTGFADLSAETLASLGETYGDRIFALDHLTIGHDPMQNARWLVHEMPADLSLDVDIIAHSRGGLVARALAERQPELGLGDRTLKIGKVVLVGTPNGGTMLANPKHMKTLLDGATTIFNAVHGEPASEAIHLIIEIVKEMAIGAYKGLVGIGSMAPGSDFLKSVNQGERLPDTRYYAIASDFTPTGSAFTTLVESKAMKIVLSGANDLIVPTASVTQKNGSAMFPVQDAHVLTGFDSATHFTLLASRAAQRQVLAWLRA